MTDYKKDGVAKHATPSFLYSALIISAGDGM